MTTRPSTPSVVSTSGRGDVPTLIRRPQRGPTGRIAAIAAAVTLLATALGPLVPGASALTLPPRPVVGPLPKAADLQIRLPDLTVDFVVVRNDTGATSFPVSRGDDLDLIAMHRNDGFGDAPLSTTRFALVREPSLRLPTDASKVAPPVGDATSGGLSATLGEVTIPAIEAGRADFPFIEGGSWRFTVPADVRGGTYRVRACADAPGAIREGFEDNNCRLSDQRLQIGA